MADNGRAGHGDHRTGEERAEGRSGMYEGKLIAPRRHFGDRG